MSRFGPLTSLIPVSAEFSGLDRKVLTLVLVIERTNRGYSKSDDDDCDCEDEK